MDDSLCFVTARAFARHFKLADAITWRCATCGARFTDPRQLELVQRHIEHLTTDGVCGPVVQEQAS